MIEEGIGLSAPGRRPPSTGRWRRCSMRWPSWCRPRARRESRSVIRRLVRCRAARAVGHAGREVAARCRPVPQDEGDVGMDCDRLDRHGPGGRRDPRRRSSSRCPRFPTSTATGGCGRCKPARWPATGSCPGARASGSRPAPACTRSTPRPTASRAGSSSRCGRWAASTSTRRRERHLELPVDQLTLGQPARGPRAAASDRRPPLPDDRGDLTVMRETAEDGPLPGARATSPSRA